MSSPYFFKQVAPAPRRSGLRPPGGCAGCVPVLGVLLLLCVTVVVVRLILRGDASTAEALPPTPTAQPTPVVVVITPPPTFTPYPTLAPLYIVVTATPAPAANRPAPPPAPRRNAPGWGASQLPTPPPANAVTGALAAVWKELSFAAHMSADGNYDKAYDCKGPKLPNTPSRDCP
jgi:hypothetical protein